MPGHRTPPLGTTFLFRIIFIYGAAAFYIEAIHVITRLPIDFAGQNDISDTKPFRLCLCHHAIS